MVVQTKHFIELADLVGLKFACKHKNCKAVLTLPMSEDALAGALLNCPSCTEPWLQQGQVYFGDTVKNVIASLKALEDLQKKVSVGFSLEVNPAITS